VFLATTAVLAACAAVPIEANDAVLSVTGSVATSPHIAAGITTAVVETSPAAAATVGTAHDTPLSVSVPAPEQPFPVEPSADERSESSLVEPASPVMASSPPVRIQVPAIGADSTLLDLGLQADGTLEVPPDADLVGWFTGGPTPGELGPAVIVGHVDWAGTQGVFYDLRDLQPGNEITITRADGSVAIFTVRSNEQFPKDQFPTAAVYGNIDHAGLRLITCGGSFDPSARSYPDNIVVFADLVGSTIS